METHPDRVWTESGPLLAETNASHEPGRRSSSPLALTVGKCIAFSRSLSCGPLKPAAAGHCHFAPALPWKDVKRCSWIDGRDTDWPENSSCQRSIRSIEFFGANLDDSTAGTFAVTEQLRGFLP